jgi:leucyl aminopeptidase
MIWNNFKFAIVEIPSEVQYGAVVQEALPKLSVSRVEAFITDFSAFKNRHYQSATGVESSEWLQAQIQESIESSAYPGVATVTPFSHSWAQDSVIARIEGSDPELKAEVVVLGAHLDSIVSGGIPSYNTAPGRSPHM